MARMVTCQKLGITGPGIPYKPFNNELGQRIFDGISMQAWTEWVEHSKKIVNEYRLDLTQKKAHEVLQEQCEAFLFGDGSGVQQRPGLRPAEGVKVDDVAMFRHLALAGRVPWVRLGTWPTPVEPLPALGAALGADLWVKREDLSSSVYGGNKVRTLEAMFGRATAAGASVMWATGAYGSNHAVATVLHAPTAGLAAGAILFPQPISEPARANLSALLSARPQVDRIASVVQLPFAMRRIGRDRGAYVMTPGGATPEGAFGAMSAGVELGEQIANGACPVPARIVVPAGSTCTSAGLLAGMRVAAALGLGFTPQTIPPLTAVRVTPWPITAPLRIARLAQLALLELATTWPRAKALADLGLLRAGVEVDGDQLRGGYGKMTARGERARLLFARHGAPPLDIVYSGKSGAALCELAPRTRGPVMFWATKSSATLPEAGPDALAAAAAPLRRWLAG